jgi:SAM-dependent methyltransferase
MRFYAEFSAWWPLFSPPDDHVEAAADLLRRLAPLPEPGAATLLELGSGGGSLAFHLKRQFVLTLTDLSEGMLAQNRKLNPEAEFVQGDLRTLRLNRQFDYVFMGDSVCYMLDAADLQAAIETAAIHCTPRGKVVIIPDYVAETYESGTDHGGTDDEDGRGFRYLWWSWDPDRSDTTYLVDFAFMMRESSGAVHVVHDRHTEGVFPKAVWFAAFARAGLFARYELDRWGRPVFTARRSRRPRPE